MKIMKKTLILIFVAALILAGCGSSGSKDDGKGDAKSGEKNPKVQTVTSSDSNLTLTVPGGWKKNEDASAAKTSMSLMSEDPSMALITIEEKISDFDGSLTLDQYSDMLITVMQAAEGSSNWNAGALADVTIGNAVPAKQRTIDMTLNGINLKYLQTVFKTPTNYVEILCWTIRSEFDAAKPKFDEILKTVNFS